VGALGASLGTMVANLTSQKRGWDSRWEEYSEWAEKGKEYYEALLNLVDQDTEAFNQIMSAFQLPKETSAEKKIRKNAIQTATLNAIKIPFRVMQSAFQSMEVIQAMAETGNPNSITDAGVGALCAATAVSGAYLNVLVNAAGFDDQEAICQILSDAEALESQAKERCCQIQRLVLGKINQR